jgi:hypothetical protein
VILPTLRTVEGWLYVAIILDLFSRKVAGWKLGESLEAELVVTALENALTMRTPGATTLFPFRSRQPVQQTGCAQTLECDRSQLKYERLGTSGIRLFRWQKASLRIIAYSCPSKGYVSILRRENKAARPLL